MIADYTLHLVLKRLPWEEIAAGRKPVEYRSLRWEPRIFGADGKPMHKRVRLQRGFTKVDGVVPTMLFAIDRIDIGPADPRWTYGLVPEGDVLQIWLGERVR